MVVTFFLSQGYIPVRHRHSKCASTSSRIGGTGTTLLKSRLYDDNSKLPLEETVRFAKGNVEQGLPRDFPHQPLPKAMRKVPFRG